MSLKETLLFRRAVRHFDTSRPLDTEVIKACIEEAQLAPTSSNLQLWEAYHIVTPELKQRVAEVCFGQTAATTADQFVVFVIRGDLAKAHAQAALAFELKNVENFSPKERWEHRKERYRTYYGKIIPFLYARCFGLMGCLRKALSSTIGLFRPIVRTVTEADVTAKNHKSCALVAQTFMLAMAERGLDTCPLEGFDEQRMKRILKLPSGAHVSLVVSCGIRTDKGVWGERFRLPFSEIYHRL